MCNCGWSLTMPHSAVVPLLPCPTIKKSGTRLLVPSGSMACSGDAVTGELSHVASAPGRAFRPPRAARWTFVASRRRAIKSSSRSSDKSTGRPQLLSTGGRAALNDALRFDPHCLVADRLACGRPLPGCRPRRRRTGRDDGGAGGRHAGGAAVHVYSLRRTRVQAARLHARHRDPAGARSHTILSPGGC